MHQRSLPTGAGSKSASRFSSFLSFLQLGRHFAVLLLGLENLSAALVGIDLEQRLMQHSIMLLRYSSAYTCSHQTWKFDRSSGTGINAFHNQEQNAGILFFYLFVGGLTRGFLLGTPHDTPEYHP